MAPVKNWQIGREMSTRSLSPARSGSLPRSSI